MSDKRLDSSHTLSVPETPLPLTTQKTQNIEPQPNVAPTHTSTRFRPSPLHRTLSSQRIAELAPAPRPSFLARLSSRKVPTISEFPRPPTPPLPELPLLDEQGMAEHEAKTKKAWELQSVALGQISAHPYPRCPQCGFKGTYTVAQCFKERHFQWCTTHKISAEFGREQCNPGFVSKGDGEKEGACELADHATWRL